MADGKGLNWVQVIAGAAAAVSTAVLLSTLGVAGTLIGAAVGSVAASIATHAYGRGLDASRERAAALRRVAEARADLDRLAGHPEEDQEAGLEHADVVLGRAEAGLQRKPLPWRPIAVAAAALFLCVMAAITGFELLTGRAVSSYTGGSDKDTPITVPGVKDKAKKPKATPKPTVTVTVTPTPTAATTPTPTTTAAPTVEPTPTPLPTPDVTASPTPEATPASVPSATP